MKIPTHCPECQSTSLKWDFMQRNLSGVQEGRLRTNEICGFFVLGCEECAETVNTVKAETISDLLNTLNLTNA